MPEKDFTYGFMYQVASPRIVLSNIVQLTAVHACEVKGLRRESLALKEAVADVTLEDRLLKKRDRQWG